mgnify:CR=1 FL=1
MKHISLIAAAAALGGPGSGRLLATAVGTPEHEPNAAIGGTHRQVDHFAGDLTGDGALVGEGKRRGVAERRRVEHHIGTSVEADIERGGRRTEVPDER